MGTQSKGMLSAGPSNADLVQGKKNVHLACSLTLSRALIISRPIP